MSCLSPSMIRKVTRPVTVLAHVPNVTIMITILKDGVLEQDEVCRNDSKLAAFICILQVPVTMKANQSWFWQWNEMKSSHNGHFGPDAKWQSLDQGMRIHARYPRYRGLYLRPRMWFLGKLWLPMGTTTTYSLGWGITNKDQIPCRQPPSYTPW